MKKSTKVKNKKASKPSASPRKRLKKYEEGGIQGLKKNTNFDPVVPGKVLQKTGEKTFFRKDKTNLVDAPTAPKADVMTMNLKSEAVPVDKQLKKIEIPTTSASSTPSATTTSIKDTKVSSKKAKLLPGGFTSEAHKKAYTQALRNKIKSGMSVDELVKKGYGTKKGLTDLGLGKYAEGLNMKKEGLKMKQEGLALKNKAKNTDYKKQWNDDLLNKAASNKKLTSKETTYIRQKYGKDVNWKGQKTSGTAKEKLAYKNALGQQFEKVKPEMRKTLEDAAMMMTPRGVIKKGVEKLGQYTLKEGAKNLIGQGKKQIATKGSQKLLSEGTKKTSSSVIKNTVNKTKDAVKSTVSKVKDPIKGAKDFARSQRAKIDRIQKGGLDKILKKSDKVVKSKKPSEETILGRTKSQIAAFEKRNKKALDNDWAIIDSYRRGGKAKTAKKTVAKVSVMRRGGKK